MVAPLEERYSELEVSGAASESTSQHGPALDQVSQAVPEDVLGDPSLHLAPGMRSVYLLSQVSKYPWLNAQWFCGTFVKQFWAGWLSDFYSPLLPNSTRYRIWAQVHSPIWAQERTNRKFLRPGSVPGTSGL